MRGKIKLSTTYCLQLNKQLEALRICYERMLVKDKNIGTNGYIFVNLHITKDCIALLVVTHSLLYVDKIARHR